LQNRFGAWVASARRHALGRRNARARRRERSLVVVRRSMRTGARARAHGCVRACVSLGTHRRLVLLNELGEALRLLLLAQSRAALSCRCSRTQRQPVVPHGLPIASAARAGAAPPPSAGHAMPRRTPRRAMRRHADVVVLCDACHVFLRQPNDATPTLSVATKLTHTSGSQGRAAARRCPRRPRGPSTT
jgi:hypothetical protein